MKKVLLVGCPNAGKSAVFNLITGKNRKVANYSGVTVDFATATFRSNSVFDEQYELVDLPGIYTLCPHTEDEAVTVAAIARENSELASADSIIVVMDFTRMESSLKLLLALKAAWKGKIISIVNKCDTDHQKERIIHSSLEQDLAIPLLPVSALNDLPDGIDRFVRKALKQEKDFPGSPIDLSVRAYEEFKIYFPTAYDNPNILIVQEDHVHQHIEDYGKLATELSLKLHKKKKCPRYQQTLAIDRMLLHPLWGAVFFILTFYLLFSAIYSWSAPFMDMIDSFVTVGGDFIGQFITNEVWRSFIVDGIIAGMGASLVFLPQIFILFFLISLLNQSGYISRASMLTDSLMSVWTEWKSFSTFSFCFCLFCSRYYGHTNH
jgi:ferrous iron transport protein B